MSRFQQVIVLGLLSAAVHLAMASEQSIAMGDSDSYPSPEHPHGWRGDGTGAWPGARPVTEWDAESGHNVVWKVDTPGAGLCQPIIAGEKVFITADPNLLLCYNVHDGSLLWQVAIDHTLLMAEKEREAARAEQAFWDARWEQYARWRYDLQVLLAKHPAVSKLMVKRGNYDTRLPRAEEAQHAQILAAIGDDAEARALYERLQRIGQENHWTRQGANNGTMIGDTDHWPLRERYAAAQQRWHLWYSGCTSWLGYTTYSFPTPVTDGRFVYVTTANNAVAAVDFDGTIHWMIWEQDLPGMGGLLHTRHVASPALHHGKLVVNQSGLLRVYDAENGRKLWEVFGPAAVAAGKKVQKGYERGNPEACSPIAFSLPLPGDRSLGLIYDGAGNLWRLDDSELLVKGLGSAQAGSGVFVSEHQTLITRYTAYRLQATDPDTVLTEQAFKNEHGKFNMYASMVVVGGKAFGQMSSGNDVKDPARRFQHPIYDIATGELGWLFKGALGNNGYISSIVAGNHVFTFPWSGDGHELALSLGHSVETSRVTVASLESGEIHHIQKGMSDLRMQGDDDWAVRNKTHGWGYQQNSSPSAQANRIFYRSRGILWCFGDPKQAFPVPKDCPEHARVK